MFDFLPEKKRQIIFRHPSLGRILNQDTVKLFSDNLRLFKNSLEADFSDDEIERIIRYAQVAYSKEFHELYSRIYHTAGFEVYFWGGSRLDLNDWIKDRDAYVRAVHNLHGFTYHGNILRDPKEYMISGMPLDNLLPWDTCKMADFQKMKLNLPHNSQIEDFPVFSGTELKPLPDDYKIPGIFRLTYPFKNQREINPVYCSFLLRDGSKPLPNVLRCGVLYEFYNYEDVIKKGTRKIQVPHPVLRRFKMVDKEEPYNYKDKEIVGVRMLSHEKIIKNGVGTRAYLLQFFIQKDVTDSGHRKAGFPVVYLIATLELAQDIVSFLFKHPDLYMQLIHGFIPNLVYPNVNKGILNAHSYATKGFVFEDYVNNKRISVDCEYYLTTRT